MKSKVEIVPVHTARTRQRFLELPFRIHAKDPNWVPRLRMDLTKIFASRTAFFAQAQMEMFLAMRGKTVVGRIAAIHNHAHNGYHGDRAGFFGFFECIQDDIEVAAFLFDATETWLRERGLNAVRGPVNPSMHSECGLLVQGFDSPPAVLMAYNPPYYADYFVSAGYTKCKDLYAYQINRCDIMPGGRLHEQLKQLERIAEQMIEMYHDIKVRSFDRFHFEEEIFSLIHAFDAARKDNWGYVPMTDAELRETSRSLRVLLDPNLVHVVEINRKPIGVFFALPDLNELLQGTNGRLFPLTFLKFLKWRQFVTQARIVAVSVLPEYRYSGIPALLLCHALNRALERNYLRAEASWVLEDNLKSNRMIRHLLKTDPYKIYRIYEKAIN